MPKDYTELDKQILEAIRSYVGIPTGRNISFEGGGKLPYPHHVIGNRLRRNTFLKKVIEAKGIEFVETCDRATFDKLVISCKGGGKIAKKVRDAIIRRVDNYILEAIKSYNGFLSAVGLGKDFGGPLAYSGSLIIMRVKKNSTLWIALESKGVEFIESCNREIFDDAIRKNKWQALSDKVWETRNRRLDRYIHEAIKSFEGIPSSYKLSKTNQGPLPYSVGLIDRRLEKNPNLLKALEDKEIEVVETSDKETFEGLTAKSGIKSTRRVRQAIDKRIDAYILNAIKSFEGVPYASNLSKFYGGPLSFSFRLIRERIDKNPSLQKAIESRSIWFIENCERKLFDYNVTTGQWKHAKGKIRESMDKRIDKYILGAINSFKGTLSLKKLCKKGGSSLEYSITLIRNRLRNNPELRRAFYLMRGLTEDRINALEAENDNPPSAFKESIRRRLPNTRIFREALGILKQFRDSFSGKRTMEVSFYPEPLNAAAQRIGIALQHNFLRAHNFKRSDFRFKTKQMFETVAFLQFCHRLKEQSLINAFNEANRILVESGTMLISLPKEFTRTEEFEVQVQDFGFELRTEGTLHIRTLSTAELVSLGIENPAKLKQKIEQATNLILLMKTRPAKGEDLDCFIPAKKLKGNGEFIPAMDEINTPEGLLLDLSSVFAKKADGLEDGFILSILDDNTYSQRHVVGFDVDPKAPNTCESYSEGKPALNPRELQRIARKLFESSFREKALVRPGRETRIPAKLIKRALG
jgi:hypothetical protein